MRRALFLAAFAAVLGIALYIYLSGVGIVTTDDAYTDGKPVGVAPDISGRIVKLNITDNQFVHKADLLLVIDPRPYIAARDRAQAGLALAKAQLASAEQALAIAKISYPAALAQAKAAREVAAANLYKAARDEKRQLSLPSGATSQQNREDAIAAANAARASLDQAEAGIAAASDVPQQIAAAEALVAEREAAVKQASAALEQALVNLSYTRITAAASGWITDRGITLGSYVQPGQVMFSLVKPNVWITANFKETQLHSLRPGQRVTIRVDAYPSLRLTGRLNSIQMGSGSVFTAFPPENATGNFVKIVQRVPVKIEITSGLPHGFPLPLGLSVEPTVQIR